MLCSSLYYIVIYMNMQAHSLGKENTQQKRHSPIYRAYRIHPRRRQGVINNPLNQAYARWISGGKSASVKTHWFIVKQERQNKSVSRKWCGSDWLTLSRPADSIIVRPWSLRRNIVCFEVKPPLTRIKISNYVLWFQEVSRLIDSQRKIG